MLESLAAADGQPGGRGSSWRASRPSAAMPPRCRRRSRPLRAASASWPAPAQEQLRELRGGGREPGGRRDARGVPQERAAARARVSAPRSPPCRTPRAEIGEPLTRFLRAAEPGAAAGRRRTTALTFECRPLQATRPRRAPRSRCGRTGTPARRRGGAARGAALQSAAGIDRAVSRRAPGRPAASWPPTSTTTTAPTCCSPAPAGCGCCRQDEAGAFADVTATTLPAALAGARPRSARGRPTSTPTATSTWSWRRSTGRVVVLRNNGDGTFAEQRPFGGGRRPARLRLGRPRRRRRPGRDAAGREGSGARVR